MLITSPLEVRKFDVPSGIDHLYQVLGGFLFEVGLLYDKIGLLLLYYVYKRSCLQARFPGSQL